MNINDLNWDGPLTVRLRAYTSDGRSKLVVEAYVHAFVAGAWTYGGRPSRSAGDVMHPVELVLSHRYGMAAKTSDRDLMRTADEVVAEAQMAAKALGIRTTKVINELADAAED